MQGTFEQNVKICFKLFRTHDLLCIFVNWKRGIERDKFILNMLISQNILCKIMAKLSMLSVGTHICLKTVRLFMQDHFANIRMFSIKNENIFNAFYLVAKSYQLHYII